MPATTNQLSSSPTTAKRPTVLQKVARKILAPIRSIPLSLPSSPIHSRSPSSNSASSSSTLPSPRTPKTMVVQMMHGHIRSRSQSPSLFPLTPGSKSSPYDGRAYTAGGGVFVFPANPPVAPASPTSSIHRRRGAIVELPNEWYAKAEEYHALGLARTRTRSERSEVRRVRSYEPSTSTKPSPHLQKPSTIGFSRGKSAQAALRRVGPVPVPVPTLDLDVDDILAWRDSFTFDDCGLSVELEEELDMLDAEV